MIHIARTDIMMLSSSSNGDIQIDLQEVEGVLIDTPTIGEMPGGRKFAACQMRTSSPIGDGPEKMNTTWTVAVHRGPAVEMMKAARKGDILRMRCILQSGQAIVPRTDGRIDLLLAD
jgi:hypothetical protein